MDNYYSDTAYVSNSELTAFQIAIGERPEIGGNKEFNYSFGSLVDALITEENLIAEEYNGVVNHDGEIIQFDEDVFNRAKKMRQDALEHPYMKLLKQNMQFQKVHRIKALEIDCEHGHVHLPFRTKMDGDNERLDTGWDLKTTAAKTQQQFINSLFLFEYDRQCAVYMDVAKRNRFVFTGVGKEPDRRTKKHPIFFYAVERDSDFYRGGRAKYQRLGCLYHLCVHSLNLEYI